MNGSLSLLFALISLLAFLVFFLLVRLAAMLRYADRLKKMIKRIESTEE